VKNSNRYKDIFSSKEQMSRSDIEKYGNQGRDISENSTEQKEMNDLFEQDAIEGWEQVSYDTSVLNTMKAKLFSQNRFSWSTAISSLIVGGILVIGYQTIINDEPRLTTLIVAEQESEKLSLVLDEINIESTEILIPAEIEKMRETEKTEQIDAKVIIDDFVQMEEFEIKFPALEPIKITVVPITLLSPVIDKINAKEIYLIDLKLIDYRVYRENPVVKTKQLILTGTSANKENESSDSFETGWKDVQIPYIQYLDKSVYYFNKGKSKKALTRFETIIQAYPLDVNANFYSGICLYNFGEYTEAINRFETCLSTEYRNFDEESIWMKALCLDHLNQKNEAKLLFQLISESRGFYANQAIEKLK